MQQPPIGWTTPVKLDKITDADTVKVSVRRQFIIRLMDDEIYFDAPETYRPATPGERIRGLEATAFLRTLLYNEDGTEKNLVIHFPGDALGRMKEITHLSRFDGQLWADGVDVVDELIKAGHVKRKNLDATTTV